MKKPIDVQIAQELYGDDWDKHEDIIISDRNQKALAGQIMQKNLSDICNRIAELISDYDNSDTVYLAFAFKRVYEILASRLDESDMAFLDDLSESVKVNLYSAVVDLDYLREMLKNKNNSNDEE